MDRGGFGALGGIVAGLWPKGSESALKSLLVDGLIGGVGGVIVFLPNIILLFLAIASLEDKEKRLEMEQAKQAEELSYSIAGRIGQAIEPALKPMGFDWRIGTALIGSFAAKEVFVVQMGIVFSMGEVDEKSESLRKELSSNYSPLVAFCIMLFCLISAPCMATIVITRKESGSWKWALLQLGGLTATAYIITTLVYQAGRLAGVGV